MGKQILPPRKRPKRSKSYLRWRVDYTDMLYDGGGSSAYTRYYMFRIQAYIMSFINCYVLAWQGKAELTDQLEAWRHRSGR